MNLRKRLIAGNWKMNGLARSLDEVQALAAALEARPAAAEVVICPPATLVERLSRILAGTPIEVGAQDCAVDSRGPHTGDIAAEMLADAGAGFVIVGHSERRADHGETSGLVAAKADAALRAGLTPIVCVGETLEQRRGGRTEETVAEQLARSLPGASAVSLCIAYEPVWAIGSGLTPSAGEIAAIHELIRRGLADRRWSDSPILYGGSVKPENAREILAIAGVDGALVGGAALKASDFEAIIRAA